MLLTKRE